MEAPAAVQHYPFQDAVNPVGGKSAPAARYANLMPAACRAELRKRKLPFKSAGGPSSGITTPLRFDGPLAGVRFVTPGRKSVYGKLDCRLALVLDDLARVLAEHGVTEVHVDNLYRPHARLPGKRKPSQHSYGLAIDIVSLVLADGRTLVVEDDWRGAIGDTPCGPQSLPRSPTDNTVDLRNLVCDVARAGLFHHMLTPNFDAAHENHLHFDIKRDGVRLVIE